MSTAAEPIFVVLDEATMLFDESGLNKVDQPSAGQQVHASLNSWLRDSPEIRRLLEEARVQLDRAVVVVCPWGWCSNDVDPVDGVILGGMGSPMCPCENLSGWNSQYVAGRAKPQVPVKAAGRHGSRVQRSTRRHTLPDWGADYVWLPVRTRDAIAATSAETTANDEKNARSH